MESYEILYQDHFKLYILFKDIIVFESGLVQKNIVYYKTESSPCQYFLLDKDRYEIDAFVIESGIVASTGTIDLTDYGQERRMQKLYIYVAVAVMILFVIASLIL